MARGWESKAVEAQIEAAAENSPQHKVLLNSETAAKLRHKEGLLLSRNRVTQQLEASRNLLHRKMLEQALADLAAQIAELD